jgi:hypothetical protein
LKTYKTDEWDKIKKGIDQEDIFIISDGKRKCVVMPHENYQSIMAYLKMTPEQIMEYHKTCDAIDSGNDQNYVELKEVLEAYQKAQKGDLSSYSTKNPFED